MKKGLVLTAMAAGLLMSCKDSKMTNVFDTDEEAEDEMRMNVTHLGDATLVQPVHVDGPVVRVKQRRRVGTDDA